MKQPKALRLADVLDLLAMDMTTPKEASAELRRLNEVNQELLNALRIITLACHLDNIDGNLGLNVDGSILDLANAAIAKATGAAS